MKILVTGGAGFIGSHTVVELVHAGFTPVIIDNFANSEPSAIVGITNILGEKPILYAGDCNDKEILRKVFTEHPDLKGVIHFAANKAVGESVQIPLQYYRNNVGSLVALLEVMAEYKITDLVFSSSCTVYGQPAKLPVEEDSPVQPANSPYGNTKQICEEVLKDTIASPNAQLKAIALRYFNPIGAHPSAEIGELPLGVPNNLVPFITQTAAGMRAQLKVFGTDYDTRDGSAIRDYIHVVDLAKAHVKAIEALQKMEGEKAYEYVNVGTGTGSTVLEVIQAFEKVSGEKLNYVLADRRPGDVEQVWAGVGKSKTLLGWDAELSLEDALRDAWKWQQAIPEM